RLSVGFGEFTLSIEGVVAGLVCNGGDLAPGAIAEDLHEKTVHDWRYLCALSRRYSSRASRRRLISVSVFRISSHSRSWRSMISICLLMSSTRRSHSATSTHIRAVLSIILAQNRSRSAVSSCSSRERAVTVLMPSPRGVGCRRQTGGGS